MLSESPSSENEVQPVCAAYAHDDIEINEGQLPPYPRLNNCTNDDLLNVILCVVLAVSVKGAEEHIKHVVASLLSLCLDTIGVVEVGVKGVVLTAEVEVTACTDSVLDCHEVYRPAVNVVGDNSTVEAHLITDYTLNKSLATTGPGVADTVIGGHDTNASAILNSLFKGNEIDLTEACSVHQVYMESRSCSVS